MKDDIKSLLNEIKSKEYVGEAGGGMVKVTIGGIDLMVKKVEIDKEIFATTVPEVLEDLDFMSDLFRAAVNQALKRSSEAITQAAGLQF